MKKQVLVSVDRGETRVALLEAPGDPVSTAAMRRRREKAAPTRGFRVAELYIERRGSRSIVGNIYKGRVDNVLPGLEAAFVDIGLDKNGFLHVDDIVMPGVEVPRRGRGRSGEGRGIADVLKPGQDVVVQVVKDPLKTKGARLSMELTIAGRYMVYAPTGEGIGVSRRLEDAERERLRKEAMLLDLGGGGAIIRTAAHGAKRVDFERELQYLFKLNEVLAKRVAESVAPAMVFQEADLSVRVVRDIFAAHFERAIVDDAKQFHRLSAFFQRTAPELVERVELYGDTDVGLLERFGVEEVLAGTLSRRVDLPSGGYLMIDYAEALTVIDVNSGSFIGRGKGARLEDTITKTNLEAAEEVVRQLRLRDIGGIIVIDFIDMARARNRDTVLKTLRKSLDEDRTKTFTADISKLGLVEMTRQNVTDGVREIMTRTCPTCNGEGVIRSEETISYELERKLRALALERGGRGAGGVEAFLIQVNPRVSGQLTGNGARALHRLEADTGKVFHFEGSEGLPLEHWDVVLEGSADEVRERAVPFAVGDEVLVDIVEPHMYEDNDAVAKIDGYIVSVRGGGRNVGEKRLVRVEEVGRTGAAASIVGGDQGGGGAESAVGSRDALGTGSGRGGGSGGRASGRGSSGRGGAAPRAAASAAEDEGGDGGSDQSGDGSPEGSAEGEAVQSRPRRRGRRGGRRRSRAAAGPPPDA
ncbi:MAG: Rne/Rng family ribonuclease [Solirubrobacteraceae bacterium]|nr:MAG: ribonuclease E [Solirubrobacterales bacterium]